MNVKLDEGSVTSTTVIQPNAIAAIQIARHAGRGHEA